jgi:hypothetical protein
MTLSLYSILALFISRYAYAAFTRNFQLKTVYRSSSNDSFSQFHDGRVEGEHLIQVPVYEAQLGAPLTMESLSLLNNGENFQKIHSSSPELPSIVNELLQIKRTSSLKSLGEVVSDDSTVNWFVARRRPVSKPSSFNELPLISLPITEAPTESNSTCESSSHQFTIPVALKQILEPKSILSNVVGYLEEEDIERLWVTNSLIQKYLNNYGIAVFKEIFPSLNGLNDSIVALRKLTKLLMEEDLKFNDWPSFALTSDIDATTTLASFVNYRLEAPGKKPKEIFALITLIEFLRRSNWHDFFKTLPGPLRIIFPDPSLKLNELKEKLLPVVMKAAHCGNLRVLKALRVDIMKCFPEHGPSLILELFLLNSETREGISWTPFQRSIHNQSIKIPCFLFYTLASDKKILEAFYKVLIRSATSEESSDMPNFMERLFLPCLAFRKLSQILRRRLLNSQAKPGFKAIHLALTKARNSEIIKLFINWEMKLNGPVNFDSFFSSSLKLVFAAKSLIALRVIRQHYYDINKIPIEMAIQSDWVEGLQEYSDFTYFKKFLLRHNNLFHLITEKNAVKVLEYLCTAVFTREEIFKLSEELDGHLRKPMDLALEVGNCEILTILQKFGAKINRNFLIKILRTNAKFLDNFLPNQHEKEVFSNNFINYESSVTLLEWSILSGNLQAFNWFLERVPLNYWKRFDGAGNTPIHLSVIVGNYEILFKLLNLDPSLLNIQNFYGETPICLARRIREKSNKSKDKQIIIDEIIQLLSKQ